MISDREKDRNMTSMFSSRKPEDMEAKTHFWLVDIELVLSIINLYLQN
jgi:hypothetical protein